MGYRIETHVGEALSATDPKDKDRVGIVSPDEHSILAVGQFTAQKSNITDRFWGAAIATFRAAETPIAVDLVSFSANWLDNGAVVIDWITASEINTAGFFVQRSSNRESGLRTEYFLWL